MANNLTKLKWGVLCLCLAFSIGLTGTAMSSTYRAYRGPALPKQQIAILKLKGVEVKMIDGKELELPEIVNSNKIELLPGAHSIKFTPVVAPVPGGYYHADDVSQTVSVEAGKTYQAKFISSASGGSVRATGYGVITTGSGRWSVKITEKGH